MSATRNGGSGTITGRGLSWYESRSPGLGAVVMTAGAAFKLFRYFIDPATVAREWPRSKAMDARDFPWR